MMYFWVIPVVLLAALALMYFFREGTKRNPAGPSRLDEARSDRRAERQQQP
jgi:hypothetical protein